MTRYNHDSLRSIQPGDQLRVTFGSVGYGTQLAEFVEWAEPVGNLRYMLVRKWSKKAQRWGLPVKIDIGQVVELIGGAA